MVKVTEGYEVESGLGEEAGPILHPFEEVHYLIEVGEYGLTLEEAAGGSSAAAANGSNHIAPKCPPSSDINPTTCADDRH
jgi:hypothetical protein